jgi:hypothetical protein
LNAVVINEVSYVPANGQTGSAKSHAKYEKGQNAEEILPGGKSWTRWDAMAAPKSKLLRRSLGGRSVGECACKSALGTRRDPLIRALTSPSFSSL